MKVTKAVKEEYTLNEVGLSRILSHTQDKGTFAIIGSEDKDTKESRYNELRDEVAHLSRKHIVKGADRIGWNDLEGTYTYENGEVGIEQSLIIYNLTKDEALAIARKLNQESIIWKDEDFFGFISADGTVGDELGRGLSFDKDAVKMYGSRLIGKHNNAQPFVYQANLVETTNRGSNFSKQNSSDTVKTVLFTITSGNPTKTVREEHSTKGAYNRYGYLANEIRFDESKVVASSESLSEGISWEVDREKLGGIIVLSTDVNAVHLDANRLKDWIKQKWETIKNRVSYNKRIDKISKKYPEIFAWTIGKYLHGRYKANDGATFDENSISIEILNVPADIVISFAEDLCYEFTQETVLVKLYGEDRILFIEPKSDYSDISGKKYKLK